MGDRKGSMAPHRDAEARRLDEAHGRGELDA